MSVVFYKEGNQKEINGFMCDTLMVDPDLFDGENMPCGWFLSPEKAHGKTEEKKVLKGNAKVRNDAKEAGIEDWETARIATLKDKLEA